MQNFETTQTQKRSDLLKRIFLPTAFFAFLVLIIYQADTAHYNFAFKMVGRIPYGDKIGHIVLYGIMAFLLNYGFKGKKWFKIQIGSLIVLVFSILEEISQAYFPSRSFDLADIMASIVGIIIFTFLFQHLKREA
ncbi:VanZ family protein [Sulfurospirillum cavolei]|uniref:VanZ family protein n=1 Tax=Sulfurospirillum cavolei TaxID=366522 RepID=UPI00076492C5|nr:VanZ family protein [Sulfurospirillum cavolei]